VRTLGIALAAVTVAAVAAAAPVAELTLSARPDVMRDSGSVVFSGTLAPAAAGETISLEIKECGGGFGYHVFGGARTADGGAWSAIEYVGFPASFRARWKDAVSRPANVRMFADVRLLHAAPSRRFPASVFSPFQNMHGRVIELQRQRPDGVWVRLGRARLERSGHGHWGATFVVRRRGLKLRAFLPQASATPCYLAATSPTVKS
jgi:hypothetical protein